MCSFGVLEYLLGIGLRAVELCLRVELFLIFWGTNRISEEMYQFVIPPSIKKCYSVSTLLTACFVTWVFDLWHSDCCKVQTQGYFDLHFKSYPFPPCFIHLHPNGFYEDAPILTRSLPPQCLGIPLYWENELGCNYPPCVSFLSIILYRAGIVEGYFVNLF